MKVTRKMKKSKKLFTGFLALTCGVTTMTAQVGINTEKPKTTLEVMGNAGNAAVADGFMMPRLTGDQLQAKDKAYDKDQISAMVYVTAPASKPSGKTQNITAEGFYYFDGSTWVSSKSSQSSSVTVTDATRFLGGSVYARFQSDAVTAIPTGTLDKKYVINGAGQEYWLGAVRVSSSSVGGINSLKGKGYTVSNPEPGTFDIKFDTPFTEIYGISVNIMDAYGYLGSSVSNGDNPVLNQPGKNLITTDNTQVAYIGNDIIRVKTGNDKGNLKNRSFTFLVTGQ